MYPVDNERLKEEIDHTIFLYTTCCLASDILAPTWGNITVFSFYTTLQPNILHLSSANYYLLYPISCRFLFIPPQLK